MQMGTVAQASAQDFDGHYRTNVFDARID